MADHTLFIFGTLRDDALRDLVLGRRVTPRPAALAGHRVMRVNGEVFPMAVPSPGACLEGALLDLTAEEMTRVVYFEDEVEFGLAEISVDTPAGPERAVMFTSNLRPSDEPWDFEDWRREGQPFFLECAREIMAHYEAGRDWSDAGLWPGVKARARARANAAAEPSRKGVGGLGRDKVATTALSYPFAGFFAVEDHRLRHPRFDGRMTPELRRLVFASGDAVTVVPYDARRDLILLVTQWRAGPHARGDKDPWPLEAIAGRIDGGEAPEEAARREAREEAGLELGRMKKIAAFYPSPGAVAEFVTAYVAEADLAEAGGVFGQDDEDEDILSLVLPLDKALAMVDDFEANTSPVLVTLLWLAARRDELRRDWAVPAGAHSGL